MASFDLGKGSLNGKTVRLWGGFGHFLGILSSVALTPFKLFRKPEP